MYPPQGQPGVYPPSESVPSYPQQVLLYYCGIVRTYYVMFVSRRGESGKGMCELCIVYIPVMLIHVQCPLLLCKQNETEMVAS